MTDENFLLSPQNARDYLVERGFMRSEDDAMSQLLARKEYVPAWRAARRGLDAF